MGLTKRIKTKKMGIWNSGSRKWCNENNEI